ncbi:MAG: major facilitator superfamily transporter [Chloroflexi bacterium OLB14]|nr:MAG: major facilitator superfamily transporter [Chloroflexi bacterium OLB14]
MASRLNYGKIFLLGFGFFGVSIVWGVYNAFVPIFLSEKIWAFCRTGWLFYDVR